MKKDKTHMRIKEDFKTEDYYRSVLKKYEADVVLFKDKIAHQKQGQICSMLLSQMTSAGL